MDLDELTWERDNKDEGIVHLTTKDKQRLYHPWRASVIIKVFEKRIPYAYLRNKLQDLWKPFEPLTLIDLGNDYHVEKFHTEVDRNKVLHEGP